MGCTASRSDTKFVQNPTFNSSSSFSNSQLLSPHTSYSDTCSTPVSRTLSLPTPLVHHPPLRKGDSNHFVALTSTTYGSLVIVGSPNPRFDGQDPADPTAMGKAQGFGNAEDPLSPDSVINTWELMEGLDDDEFHYNMVDVDADLVPRISGNKRDQMIDSSEIVESYEIVEHPVSKPLWQHLSDESDIESSLSFGCQKPKEPSRTSAISSLETNIGVSDNSDRTSDPSGGRIVLYYTSLRGIRKTYEDCCTVRVIFRGFRVCVDECDISMDRSYRAELQDALKGKPMRLPQVFINGKCIGAAEEIKQLNETGELAKLLEGFPTMDLGCVCDSCGDARFVPCPNCNGSQKVYKMDEGVLRKCPDCNENGLVRCSGCCP